MRPDQLRPCRFTFDDTTDFAGFTNDTYWNGFLNVWCTPAVLEEVIQWCGFVNVEVDGQEQQSIDDMRALPVKDGLVCLGWGYATSEAEPRETPMVKQPQPLPKEIEQPLAASEDAAFECGYHDSDNDYHATHCDAREEVRAVLARREAERRVMILALKSVATSGGGVTGFELRNVARMALHQVGEVQP